MKESQRLIQVGISRKMEPNKAVVISGAVALLEGIGILGIDEEQDIQDIGGKLKLIIDEIKDIRVIATASSSFDLLNKTGEPLLGRTTQFYLTPFSQKEISQREDAQETNQNRETRLIYGSYPEVVTLTTVEKKKEYLRDIVGAYLQKDVLAIGSIQNSGEMRDLLKQITFQMGNEVSYDEFGRNLGMSKNTVERHLDLLSKVFVVYCHGAYSKNLRRAGNRFDIRV